MYSGIPNIQWPGSVVSENLRKLTDDSRLEREKSISFNSTVVRLLAGLWRNQWDVMGVRNHKDAFAIAFSPEKNQSTWAIAFDQEVFEFR